MEILETDYRFVRYPTAQEIQDLKKCMARDMVEEVTQADQDEADALVDQSCLAVFPNYMTDGPGYSGPILFVVYGGGPYTRAAYIRDENKEWERINENC